MILFLLLLLQNRTMTTEESYPPYVVNYANKSTKHPEIGCDIFKVHIRKNSWPLQIVWQAVGQVYYPQPNDRDQE